MFFFSSFLGLDKESKRKDTIILASGKHLVQIFGSNTQACTQLDLMLALKPDDLIFFGTQLYPEVR